MTFTADQYSQIAEGYEKAAADPLVASEKRPDLAKKAEWFRFLAQRERTHGLCKEQGIMAPMSLDAEPKSRGRSWRSMAPFLTTLWITGAAVYLVSTVLLTNAVNLFGTEEPKTPVHEITRSAGSLPKVSSVESKTADQAPLETDPDRRHAISLDQQTYESPSLTVSAASVPKEESGLPHSLEPIAPGPQEDELASSDPVQVVGEAQPTEMLIVIAAATIRNGPFTAAKKIGTASAGAELQVKAREKDWVQFIDLSSGNTGWVQAALLAPVDGLGVPKASDTPPVKPAKPKLAKKKPAPAQVSPRPRAYADLPSDEEFLPPRRRGPGLLSRRRMLREGLMSPDFLPPQ